MTVARELWKRIETIHAVTYFAHESITAAKDAGLRGFWMGYFGFRAAPLGAVGPGAVEASFANFAPSMVRRSLPDAWTYARPLDLIGARASAAATALRRLHPAIDAVAGKSNRTLDAIARECPPIGRPMCAANREIDAFDDPVAQLWQHCTTLREHRGDGHVIALAAAAIDGCEAHRLLIADQQLPAEVFRDNRGWSETEWADAGDRLISRGLLDGDELTAAGRLLRSDIEKRTDSLALEPYSRAQVATGELLDNLGAVAEAIAASGVIPYPNPIGLPRIVQE